MFLLDWLFGLDFSLSSYLFFVIASESDVVFLYSFSLGSPEWQKKVTFETSFS